MFLKSDVKGFYESINHSILLAQVTDLCPCPLLLKLMTDFLEHTEEYGGLYTTWTNGISKSCPLSPLLGAIYLSPLDNAMKSLPVKYIRFMDDWLIFAKTRWQLRKAIKKTNQILNELKVLKHPDKTFAGRVSRTFEFCGFRFSTNGVVALAQATQLKLTKTLTRLYEQGRRSTVKLEKYQAAFLVWVRGTLGLAGGDVTWSSPPLLELLSPGINSFGNSLLGATDDEPNISRCRAGCGPKQGAKRT